MGRRILVDLKDNCDNLKLYITYSKGATLEQLLQIHNVTVALGIVPLPKVLLLMFWIIWLS